MSYLYSNEIKYSDSPDLDAFGRLRTSGITSLLEYKHVYDDLPLTMSQVVGGIGATANYSYSQSQVVMTVTSTNNYVIRQGKSRAIYQPGKSQLMEASFGNFQIESQVIKRVGYFEGATGAPYNTMYDGFFVESNGNTNEVSFQVWNNGANLVNSPLSSWLTADYDPALIDWTNVQLMVVDFQWLGVGRIRFGLVIDGITRVFVSRSSVNIDPGVYMRSPNHPIRYEIRSAGGSGSLNMICSQVSLEGTLNNLEETVFIDNFTARTLVSSALKYPLIGYRVNSGSMGSNLNLQSVGVINSTNGTKADYIITVELNPVLSSIPSFTNIPNTPVDYALGTGAKTVTSSGHRIAGYLGSGTSTQSSDFFFQNNILRPGFSISGVQDEIWICVQASSGNQDFRSAININYYD